MQSFSTSHKDQDLESHPVLMKAFNGWNVLLLSWLISQDKFKDFERNTASDFFTDSIEPK